MSFYKQDKPDKWKALKKEALWFTPLEHKSFDTKSIHSFQTPEPIFGSVNIPIHYTSTYAQTYPGKPFNEFDYSRGGNPTVKAVGNILADLEYGQFGVAFSSGCAAMNAILGMLASGDHVICGDDVYGGTNRILNRNFVKFGLQVSMIELTPDNLEAAIKENTKLLVFESPTNPTLKIFDIESLSKIARAKGVITVVDNTFASPYLQSPLLLGADLALHSGTKYLGGHSDVISGFVATNSKPLYEKVHYNLMSLGGCMSPMDAFLLTRSMKTLKARMNEHCRNARVIAHYLNTHPQVSHVNYPGLPSHPNHDIAKRQMRDFGGVISFVLDGSEADVVLFMQTTKLFLLAESLGGVESLIESPALMTHLSVPADQREKLGIKTTLIRISVGIEDMDDLLDDLENAFNKIKENN